ncbi:MAG TPA: carboxypeptidase-like regulatory domain-containing protein [Terriglobia bacterium]|nr:carboxypeptidase-like regulatory domain-containing protein [Terriglobia bacterium]
MADSRYDWLGISLLATLFVIIPSHLALAQNTARVDGVVHDQSGALVPGASVVLRNEAQGTEFRAKTDATGTYSIDLVPAATYTLIVQMPGFKTYSRTGVLIHLDDRLSIPVSLEVGQQVQTVEVTAQAAQLVTTDSGAKTDVIAAAQIENLSTLGRNAVELLALLPGVVNSGFSPLNGSSFGLGVDAFNVNGLRSDMNDVRLDNAHMIDPGCNCGNIVEPNMDMIQEFSLKTSNFEADQGRSAMIMDTVVKSGGSAYHGEAYYYGRNAYFNANDWSNNLAGVARPASKFNYPGFNIGGPVRFPGSDFNKSKDKMFFFAAVEWQRQLPDPGTELATVPTAKMRTGDFSELLNSKFCTTDSSGNVTGGRFLNMPCIVTDPTSGWNNTALPGNMIPQSQITQNGMNFLKVFPLPNYVDPNGRYNFSGRPLLPLNRNEQMIRVDYNINDTTRAYIRLARNADHQYYPYGLWSGENSGWTSNIPEPTPTIGNNNGQSISINVVKIINPTLTNEVQFNTQALRLPNHYADPKKLSRTALGFNFSGMKFQVPNLPAFANGVKTTSDFIPQITDAWDYYGGNPGAGRWGEGDVGNRVFADKTEFEWLDNLTKVHGTHTMKFGGNIDRTRNDQNGLGTAPEGMFITNNWGGYSTGNEFGDILTENFRSFEQQIPDNDGLWRFWNVEWYAQDSWKATRRLTLNYGARFSWMQPWNEARGLSTTFIPSLYDPAQPTNFLNGIRTGQANQVSHSVFPNPSPVIQPRIGFAFDVFGTGKTVLRGGLGTFVTRDQGNVSFYMASADPFSFNATVGATGSVPTLSMAAIQAADPFGALGNITVQAEDPHDPNQPQTYEWSFTLSQNVGLKTVLEGSYVGNMSRHLYRQFNVNAIRPGGMFIPGTTECCAPNPNGSSPTTGDTTANDFRFYKPFAAIDWSSHSDTANYNSLQVTARRNVSTGLTLLASYTWSKTLGYTTSFQGVVDPFDSHRNYGYAPWDRSQILNFSYIYQMPKPAAKHNWNRVAKGVLDSWQLSGITHYTSGAPLGNNIGITNIACTPGPGAPSNICQAGSFDNGLSQFSGGNIGWYGTPDITLRPVITWQGGGSNGVGGHWVSPSSITLPGFNQFGTFEAPIFRGPGSYNWDFTLFKSFPLGESRRIEFRLAAFDVLNHANLDNPQMSASFNWVVPKGATSFSQGTPVLNNPANFGVVTDAHGHREIEGALKFYF